MDRSLWFGCGGLVVVVRSSQVNCYCLVASWSLRVGWCGSVAVGWLVWVGRYESVAVRFSPWICCCGFVVLGLSLWVGRYGSVVVGRPLRG